MASAAWLLAMLAQAAAVQPIRIHTLKGTILVAIQKQAPKHMSACSRMLVHGCRSDFIARAGCGRELHGTAHGTGASLRPAPRTSDGPVAGLPPERGRGMPAGRAGLSDGAVPVTRGRRCRRRPRRRGPAMRRTSNPRGGERLGGQLAFPVHPVACLASVAELGGHLGGRRQQDQRIRGRRPAASRWQRLLAQAQRPERAHRKIHRRGEAWRLDGFVHG